MDLAIGIIILLLFFWLILGSGIFFKIMIASLITVTLGLYLNKKWEESKLKKRISKGIDNGVDRLINKLAVILDKLDKGNDKK